MNTTNGANKLNTQPAARPDSMVRGKTYRFTVLTSRLIRLEYDADGLFEDRATRFAVCRAFPPVPFRVAEKADRLEIVTEDLHLTYDKKAFSPAGLSIRLKGNWSWYSSVWHYGQELETLKGTARTLDEADGPVELEEGLIARTGFSVVDDSRTVAFREDGWIEPVTKDRADLYFFGYGRDYPACLKDFYRLSGPTPLLPRYALGNWWSRFHRYSEREYTELLKRFKEENIPFSVAVLDMDWHLTEIDEKFGSGWTGYTWNRELFPDPARFLRMLHEKGMHVTLNVHPAEGVRAFEESYAAMAKAMGRSTAQGDPIPFDASDPVFLANYFEYLHHPGEEAGVDFWWIDWQQNGGSRREGIDPQWVLNHFHFLDNARGGRPGLILSRYAGAGSHRYPIGFSGDSFATWRSLAFQPYFTATASNIGYGWWSHDIGGHMHGIRSDEMAVRWLQFGVFSPILRIHSSGNPFNGKEPWSFGPAAEEVMKRFLRLRHRLVPYLYTMNARLHREGIPLMLPMYYLEPEAEEAYGVPNEYAFGSELIVCPITEPADPRLQTASFRAWLPACLYFDVFDGRAYRGGRRITLYRGLETLPVLAKAGSVVPLAGENTIGNSTENPAELELLVFAGADGRFELYEDRGGADGAVPGPEGAALTPLEFRWGKTCSLSIGPCEGDAGAVPARRSYTVRLAGIHRPEEVSLFAGGEPAACEAGYDPEKCRLTVSFGPVPTGRELRLQVRTDGGIALRDPLPQAFELLNRAQMEIDLKSEIYAVLQKQEPVLSRLGELQAMGLDAGLTGALYEIFGAA